MTPARRAFQVVATLHFSEPRPEVLDFAAIKQSVERGNSGRTPDENLNPAGIASDVRFFLLRDPHLSGISADRTRKHSFSA